MRERLEVGGGSGFLRMEVMRMARFSSILLLFLIIVAQTVTGVLGSTQISLLNVRMPRVVLALIGGIGTLICMHTCARVNLCARVFRWYGACVCYDFEGT